MILCFWVFIYLQHLWCILPKGGLGPELKVGPVKPVTHPIILTQSNYNILSKAKVKVSLLAIVTKVGPNILSAILNGC